MYEENIQKHYWISLIWITIYSHLITTEICNVLLGLLQYVKTACIYHNRKSELVWWAKTGKVNGLLMQNIVAMIQCLHLSWEVFLFLFSLFNENVSTLEVDLSTQEFITGGETSTLLVKFVIMSKHPETRTQVE